ncbi:MAG: polynucleotide kinase-phosphatase, partial [Lewinella sp.]
VYTRTGRNFFTDPGLEGQFLARVVAALTKSGFWEKLDTDWVCLDTELLPWSAKAQSLIREQYAAVGAAAGNALPAVTEALRATQARGVEGVGAVLDKFAYKEAAVDRYTAAYRNYCWAVNSVDDYRLAPFHVLATEGAVHVDKPHEWHMETIRGMAAGDGKLFQSTPYRIVETADPEQVKDATDWWLALTAAGGEGMVVKPYDFVAYGKGGLLQPAVKCRGREYLRIIYGPEYDLPEHLSRLKKRGLGKKRSLALREFALGVEALERCIRREPLRRIHESVFGVLALESEAVDPRL